MARKVKFTDFIPMQEELRALKAENERLTKDVEFYKQQFNDQVESREELERALAERAGGVNEDALRALAQAYDREDAAQRGEPDPWNLDDPGDIGDSDTWVSERLACARAAAEAFLPALTTEPAAQAPVWIAEERLSSLLARIHRDGGHYEARHGTEKALADADSIIAGLYADVTHPAHSPAASEGRQEAVRIGDAVLDWMVKFDLLDAGNEYYVSDVLAVLNDLTPSTRPSEQVVTEAARDVLAERRRQIEAEGWTPEHDNIHSGGQIATAAACYAAFTDAGDPPRFWPWSKEWWKPTDRRRNLVKAAALILAEIERLDRAALNAAMEAGHHD